MAKPDTVPTETPEEMALRAAVQTGVVSLDAGRSVPYEDVRKWLLTWGSDNELPSPKCP